MTQDSSPFIGGLFGGTIGGAVGTFAGHPLLGLGLGAIVGSIANMMLSDSSSDSGSGSKDPSPYLSISDRGINVPRPATSPQQAAERLLDDATRLNTVDPLEGDDGSEGAGAGELSDLLSDIRGGK
jgi:hypothetical protein